MKQLPWIWVDHRTDLPKWLTEAIGRIAAEWSALEWQYEETIRQLLDVSIKNGRIVTTGMSARSRILTTTNLVQGYVYARKLPPSFLEEIIDLSDAAEKLESERNKIAHGLWGLVNGKWNVLRNSSTRTVPELRPEIKKLSRAVLPQREPMTLNNMYEIVEKIKALRRDLDSFGSKLEGALPPSPHKSPRQLHQDHPRRARRKKARASQL